MSLKALFFSCPVIVWLIIPCGDTFGHDTNSIGENGFLSHAVSASNSKVQFAAPNSAFKAYEREVLSLVITEANRAARALQLPESLPITEKDLAQRYICPPRIARDLKAPGNVTTRHFTYYVSLDNKLSYIEGMHQEQDLWKWKATHLWPMSWMDTNGAYQMATQWLEAVSMDVRALNRDYPVVITAEKVPGEQERFVPVYWVYWAKQPKGSGSAASVRLFAPTKMLMQLRVEDPKYILRKPVSSTNLAVLLAEPRK